MARRLTDFVQLGNPPQKYVDKRNEGSTYRIGQLPLKDGAVPRGWIPSRPSSNSRSPR